MRANGRLPIMRLRFWEPDPDPVSLPPSGHLHVSLPARRLNLTDLDRFARHMARGVGAAEESYEMTRRKTGENHLDNQVAVRWEELGDLADDQLGQVEIRVTAPEGAKPMPDLVPTQTAMLYLSLGNGRSNPATLGGTGVSAASGLEKLWSQLGRRRPTWSLAYPAVFLLAAIAALAPFVWLWARHQLSLWLILPVVVLTILAFAVGAPLVQERVKRHRATRAGLDIDFKPLSGVRARRELVKYTLLSGFGGAALGAVIALVVVWITVTNQAPQK